MAILHHSTDQDWELLAQADAYWSILTDDRFRKADASEDALEEFFASGEQYVATILEIIRTHVDPSFTMKTACDFGCGVGRLLIPLARRCEKVVGLDVSPSMLHECRQNMTRHRLTNFDLVRNSDSLAELIGTFDLIHSIIVFQHIPVARGMQIVRNLLSHLSNSGVVVLQFKSYPQQSGRTRRTSIYRQLGKLLKRPVMQMNSYPLNELFWLLQDRQLNQCHVRFTDHGPREKGVLVFAQKNLNIAHPDSF